MKTILISILFMTPLLSISQILSRSIISSGGKIFQNNEVIMNGTIGEPIVGLVSSSTGAIDQGFWAGYLVLETFSEDSAAEELVLYPVPVESHLNILTNNNELLGLRLFSLGGKLIKNQSFTSTPTEISLPMQEVSSGTYVLHVFLKNGRGTKRYQILKR